MYHMTDPSELIVYPQQNNHYDDVIMGEIASLLTSLMTVYSTVYSGADQRKHQSSAPLASVWGIHRGPVNSPQKGPVTRKMFPFGDVIMNTSNPGYIYKCRFWNDFWPIHTCCLESSLCYYRVHLWRLGVDWNCDVIVDVDVGESKTLIWTRFMHEISASIQITV